MSYDQYYLRARNKYTVHFANTAGLSAEEIKDIFSNFGNIVGFNIAGDLHGYHFVSYATLKETISSISELKNHEFIKLLPERSKLDKETNKIDDNNTEDSSKSKKNYNKNKNKNEEGFFRIKKGCNKNKNRGEQRNKIKCTTRMNEVLWDEENDSEDYKSNEGSTKHFKMSRVSRKPAELHMRSNIQSNKELDKFFDLGNSNTFSDSGSLCQKDNASYIDEIPSLISDDISVHTRSIESLNEISSSTRSITESKIVVAQHIIVANVHKEYNIHFILHLFDKYDPIAISLMKEIHGTGIRYCHVYLKSLEDALKVEQKFDKYALNSKRLIVMRSCRLLEEAMME